MTVPLLASMLFVGFSLGLLHALDVDHLVTISSLSARTNSRKATAVYAALWALGHGSLLIVIAATVIMMGWSLPAFLPAGAERTVGLILLGAGSSVVWQFARCKGAEPSVPRRRTLREEVPFLIGMVHGLAGSAAMLALVPVTLYRPTRGILYAVVFSVGVLAGMMGFGIMLARLQHALAERLPKTLAFARLSIGVFAMGMGVQWLRVV